MDFHSLQRRDLQFFCKRNKIPANITNIAMADALQALEIVEGINEFANQSESTYDQSPTSVAKNMPSAARTTARTTRRKATKDESELVTRSCLVTSKSSSEEMDQENRNANMLLPQSRQRAAVKLDVTDIKLEANVSKTPAARSTRSTRRTQAAAASSKKEESVQRVYSTRRAVKLLEESMADLSLKTSVPSKKMEDSPTSMQCSQAKPDENLEQIEEAEVISMRDLNDSLEKEWDDSLKNDPDLDVLYGDLGDITFSDATTKSNIAQGSESFVLVKEQETLKKVEDEFVVVESESEKLKNGSESETEYETDPSDDDDDDDDDDDTNQETFGLVSDKEMMTQAPVAEKKLESESEWSDTDFEISDMEENSCESESVMAPISDKKTPFETESETLNSNGDEEEKKKKMIDEGSLKDVSMRKLTKMVKELALKNKQATTTQNGLE